MGLANSPETGRDHSCRALGRFGSELGRSPGLLPFPLPDLACPGSPQVLLCGVCRLTGGPWSGPGSHQGRPLELLHVWSQGGLRPAATEGGLAFPAPDVLCQQPRPRVCECRSTERMCWGAPHSPVLVSLRKPCGSTLHWAFHPLHTVLFLFQDPPKVYPPVPAEKRKPIRVLSLFDGIATGEPKPSAWTSFLYGRGSMALLICWRVYVDGLLCVWILGWLLPAPHFPFPVVLALCLPNVQGWGLGCEPSHPSLFPFQGVCCNSQQRLETPLKNIYLLPYKIRIQLNSSVQ